MTAAVSDPSRTIAITGATGSVGGALCEAFAAKGWIVRGLSRQRPSGAVPWQWFRCDLPDEIDPRAFAGCGVVIHAAYATRARSEAEARRVNEDGTARVLKLTNDAGARLVFISSLSAHEGARSYYGRSKLAIERSLDPARDLVIRPGLVLGAPAGGVFGAMAGQVRSRRLIPLVGGGTQPLQTIHIDDLGAGVVSAVEQGLVGRLLLAEPSPITLSRFLSLVAERLERKPRFVPVPAWAVLGGVRLFEACGVHPPISSENVRGLMALRAEDTRADLARLNLSVRPAEQSLRDLPL
jgi:NADH dehydrogenase